MTLSLAEENYLKAIYHLSLDGAKGVLTNALADAMNTKAASVTDMVKKLSAKSLISYKKYYGVNITAKGKSQALQVIRRHRLWETFLVRKLGLAWDEVHEIAEQLEHIRSKRLIEKLDKFLEYPTVDPHGDPIPNQKGKIVATPQMPLCQAPIGYAGTIVAVSDSSPDFLKYLEKIGAIPGKKIKVMNIEVYDASMEVVVGNHKTIVSREVSKNILVTE
ncbi:MAG TPA: metal-dependent transcriptional regulator [Cyclobacteriaceae bacterium]|nr:metal-dependent transcriptional regulator [Cyclobacteriaceae bacterium]MCB0499383.1 metal-dependent transcriptional regulator [Cyclobacteriaceae bacterium]MCB9236461.1 metal-dependent transcriptional regulator [Flammeovirgaceae bacterium]MCO5272220.1 metal-dependent transcriptional regulator [Cyclobacteriaceae bacterium]HOO10147.1 metal-dependent transcriptional regulator [Cyclobacteriaceae bacterium]